MSYYMMNYQMTDPGTPGWQFAPYPSWGMNPAAAGPPRIGVGCTTCPGGVGQERVAPDVESSYRTTSWGMVAAVGAGALLVGVFLGYVAGQRSKLKPNRPRRRRQARVRRYSANARWSTKYQNQMPDSHFAYVEPGGRKVRTKRGTFTIPKSKRKLPYVNLQGRVDRSHVLNAISRLGQKRTDIPERKKKELQQRLRRLYEREFGYKSGVPAQIAA